MKRTRDLSACLLPALLPALLLSVGLALPAAAQQSEGDPLPPPGGPLLAEWVTNALITDSVRLAPSTAEQLYDRANLRADSAIARETTNRVLSKLGSDLTGPVIGCTGGIVTLRGRVADVEQRDLAGATARAVPGVKGVNNLLLAPGEAPDADAVLLTPEDAGPGLSAPFDFLTGDLLAGRGMQVEADDGIVVIRGEVNCSAAQRFVVETARGLPGVRVVRNLTSVLATDRNHDLRLAVLVQRRLEWEPELQPVVNHIEVGVRNGVVLLSGAVRTDYQRSLAAAIAAHLSLVFAVDQRLEVNPSLGPGDDADWPPRTHGTTNTGSTLPYYRN